MKSFRFNLSKAFLAITLLAIPLAVYGTVEFNRRREEMLHAQLQQELNTTETRLKSGALHLHQPVSEYLGLATPCELKHLGPYSEFQHGFPGGLGHGITIVSKDEKLMRAYFWSCMRGEEFFNAMTENDQNEFDKLWSTARANSLREN